MIPLQLIGMKREPSQARGMARVTAILDACEILLGKKRYGDISIDEIIAEAKVTKGTLYHFFKDRRSVFLAAMHRALIDIDDQADPRDGEENLDFASYMAKVEKRLEGVWRKHRHLVEFYESNKYAPDYGRPEFSTQIRSQKIIAAELLNRHPEVGSSRANDISRILLQAMYTGLDEVALYPSRGKSGFKREWRAMIAAYVETFTRS